MLKLTRWLGAAALAIGAIAAPAQAEVVTLSGTGFLVAPGGLNGGSGAPAVGQQVNALLQFDTAASQIPIVADFDRRIYQLFPTVRIGSIGSHVIIPTTSTNIAFLILSRSFGLFGQPAGEAVVIQTFQFSGIGGPTAPVSLNGRPAVREVLTFTNIFQTGSATPSLSITDFRDPTGLPGQWTYRAFAGPLATDASSTISGPGALFRVPAIGAVPEPATWALMILGFGVIGGAMRKAVRRQGAAAWGEGNSARVTVQ